MIRSINQSIPMLLVNITYATVRRKNRYEWRKWKRCPRPFHVLYPVLLDKKKELIIIYRNSKLKTAVIIVIGKYCGQAFAA